MVDMNQLSNMLIESSQNESKMAILLSTVINEDSIEKFKIASNNTRKKLEKEIKRLCSDCIDDYVNNVRILHVLQESLTEIDQTVFSTVSQVKDATSDVFKERKLLFDSSKQLDQINLSLKLLYQTQEVFGILQKIELLISEGKLINAITYVNSFNDIPLLKNEEIKKIPNVAKLIEYAIKKNEHLKKILIIKKDQLIYSWQGKLKQSQLSIGRSILSEIAQNVQYIEMFSPISNVLTPKTERFSILGKQSILFNPFSVVMNASKGSIIAQNMQSKASTIQKISLMMASFSKNRESQMQPLKATKFLNKGGMISKEETSFHNKSIVSVEHQVDLDTLDKILIVSEKLGEITKFYDDFKAYRANEMKSLASIANSKEVERNLTELIGYLVVQMNILTFCENLCSVDDFENIWNEVLNILEQNIKDKISGDDGIETLLALKTQIIYFTAAAHKIGFFIQNSLIEILARNVNIYVEKLDAQYTEKYMTSIQKEDYCQLEVTDISEYEKYVSQYCLNAIENVQLLKFPMKLSYTKSACELVDIIKNAINLVFNFLTLISEEDYLLRSLYESVDKIINHVILLFLPSKGSPLKISIGQRGIILGNLNFVKSCLPFFESYILKLTKKAISNFKLNIDKSMEQIIPEFEETLYSLFDAKIINYIKNYEKIDWNPKEFKSSHEDFLFEMVQFVQINIMQIEDTNKLLAESCYAHMFQCFSASLLDVMSSKKSYVTTLNIIAIYNILKDITFLETSMSGSQSVSKIAFEKLNGLKNSISLITLIPDKNFQILVNNQENDEVYKYVEIQDVINILQKMKEIKGNEDDPRVSQFTHKKIKEAIEILNKKLH